MSKHIKKKIEGIVTEYRELISEAERGEQEAIERKDYAQAQYLHVLQLATRELIIQLKPLIQ